MWQTKNNKNTSINLILPFTIPNLSPAARHRDGGETTDEEQKHDNPKNLTFGHHHLLLFAFRNNQNPKYQHKNYYLVVFWVVYSTRNKESIVLLKLKNQVAC